MSKGAKATASSVKAKGGAKASTGAVHTGSQPKAVSASKESVKSIVPAELAKESCSHDKVTRSQ